MSVDASSARRHDLRTRCHKLAQGRHNALSVHEHMYMSTASWWFHVCNNLLRAPSPVSPAHKLWPFPASHGRAHPQAGAIPGDTTPSKVPDVQKPPSTWLVVIMRAPASKEGTMPFGRSPARSEPANRPVFLEHVQLGKGTSNTTPLPARLTLNTRLRCQQCFPYRRRMTPSRAIVSWVRMVENILPVAREQHRALHVARELDAAECAGGVCRHELGLSR